jgi:hypothetical protein
MCAYYILLFIIINFSGRESLYYITVISMLEGGHLYPLPPNWDRFVRCR